MPDNEQLLFKALVDCVNEMHSYRLAMSDRLGGATVIPPTCVENTARRLLADLQHSNPNP